MRSTLPSTLSSVTSRSGSEVPAFGVPCSGLAAAPAFLTSAAVQCIPQNGPIRPTEAGNRKAHASIDHSRFVDASSVPQQREGLTECQPRLDWLYPQSWCRSDPNCTFGSVIPGSALYILCRVCDMGPVLRARSGGNRTVPYRIGIPTSPDCTPGEDKLLPGSHPGRAPHGPTRLRADVPLRLREKRHLSVARVDE